MFVCNYNRKTFVVDHRQKYVEIAKDCLWIEIADECLQFLRQNICSVAKPIALQTNDCRYDWWLYLDFERRQTSAFSTVKTFAVSEGRENWFLELLWLN